MGMFDRFIIALATLPLAACAEREEPKMIRKIEDVRAFLAGRSFAASPGLGLETFCPDGQWSTVISQIDMRQYTGRWSLQYDETQQVLVCVKSDSDTRGTPISSKPVCRVVVALTGPERLVIVGARSDDPAQAAQKPTGLLLPEQKTPDCH